MKSIRFVRAELASEDELALRSQSKNHPGVKIRLLTAFILFRFSGGKIGSGVLCILDFTPIPGLVYPTFS